MEFCKFRSKMQAHFIKMAHGATHLFTIEVNKDELWNLYLDSFPPGTNEVYRVKREYDCSCCRHAFKAIANVVSLKDGKMTTMWDFKTGSSIFQPVVNALSAYLHSQPLKLGVWVNKERNIGVVNNFGIENGKAVKYNHFYLDIPATFISSGRDTIGTEVGSYRATAEVFYRSLSELTQDSMETVLELIAQNSLYRGEEWKAALEQFLFYKKAFSNLLPTEKILYAWEKSVIAGPGVGRIRNHSMGTLLIDLSAGMEIDEAVRRYEAIVAPTNYKRPKAIFTKSMLAKAQKDIEKMGYGPALARRYATLEDISVADVLFSNKDSAKRMSGTTGLFEDLGRSVPVSAKQFSRIESISIDKFISNVLPSARELDVLVENKHSPNLVSLIAPKDKTAPSLFKWTNGFGWAYNGNIADSQLKERVKSAGGKVDGILRFSIQWNDVDHDNNDLDAHCFEPDGNRICFSNKRSASRGNLDVDIIRPQQGKPAVENITWPNLDRMKPGNYQFLVHCYSNLGGRRGFRAEIEFDGQVFSFNYDKAVNYKEFVHVADVALTKDGQFSIQEKLSSSVSSHSMWGISTNAFVPVSVAMLSPNHWEQEKGIGNKHYFFMLKECVNDQSPNGIFNEFLKEELLVHKRVFEALGQKLAVEPNPAQLSGLGFSSTQRNSLVVKVKGQTERILKIIF